MKILDVLNAPWAITPAKKAEINEIYATHLRGEKIDLKGVEAAIGRPLANEQTAYTNRKGVAVIEVDGVIAKKMNMFSRISGGVSTQLLASTFRQALDDRGVTAIVMVVDSPGGEVDGTQDLAELIYSSRDVKPIVTLADGLMASAGYWIGAAAGKVYAANDTTIVGSIGVVASHTDVSKAEESYGYKTTEITAGRYKRIASQYAPLSPEGRQSIQDQVDYIYSVFLDAVAKYRGAASAEAVHESMADGRLFFGQQAVDNGLVDGVATLDQIIESLSKGEFPDVTTGARAAVSVLPGLALTPSAVAGDADADQPTTESSHMAVTKEQFVAENPAAAAELRAEGETAGVAKGKAEGKAEGATAERERIQAVFGQSLPGHEALIQTLAFDGKTSGPEAAVAVLNAERSNTATNAAALRADAPKPAPNAPAPDAPAAPAAGEKKVDHKVVTRKAQAYRAEQEAKGIHCTATEAVRHVMALEAE